MMQLVADKKRICCEKVKSLKRARIYHHDLRLVWATLPSLKFILGLCTVTVPKGDLILKHSIFWILSFGSTQLLFL